MTKKNAYIHPTAIIDPTAKIADDVVIGAYSVIGHDVTIDSGCWLGSHVVIEKWTTIGKNNKFYPFAAIGSDPQDSHYKEEESYLIIGNDNVFHSSVTINRGTTKQDLRTIIGNDNLFMAYTHLGHDCIVGDHIVFANGAVLAGHVNVDNYATIGAYCAVHQFCQIGAYSFTSHGAMVSKDVLPYLMVIGNDVKTYGLNTVGLQRNGFSKETIAYLQKAYKIIFRNNLLTADALIELKKMVHDCPEVSAFVQSIENAKRGFIR